MAISRLDRAKQFLPFDALCGFREALRKKEIEIEEKIELSEESLEELEKEFNKLEKGRNAKIKYYKDNQYINVNGIVTNIDYIRKRITINKTENINLCDIFKINT